MLRVFLLLSILFPVAHGGEPLPALKLTSKHMRTHNPLLPKLEPKLWQKLIEAEKKLENSPDERTVQKDFLELAAKLTSLHKLLP